MASTTSVGKTTAVAPRDLNTFHRNPRKGDVKAIAASLKAHSQYKPITANVGTHTGRPNEVLAGNHTLMAVRNLAETDPDDKRWTKVLVHWVDVDDDMCNRIVTADNQTSQLGGFDSEELLALLEDIGDIEGLGFSEVDVAELQALVEEQTPPSTIVDPFGEGGDKEPERKPFLDPDTGLMNVKDIATNSTEYAEQTARMVVMSLPVPQFVWAQAQMTKLRDEREVGTNSDLLLSLLAEATGETPPEPDEAVTQAEVEAAVDADPEGDGPETVE